MEIASNFKVAYHKEKLQAYLNNQNIYPATLELDITSRCTRTCSDCPSSRSSFARNLSMKFIEHLFSYLEGQTRGLLLTGGEPTMASHFPQVLSLARKSGFIDIAVVTNGSLLDKSQVISALLNHASTIRVSLYGWDDRGSNGVSAVLKKIEALRKAAEQERSDLQIGISFLTSSERTPFFENITDTVKSSGAHWIYFHPLCTGWNSGQPKKVAQEGVAAKIQDLQKSDRNGFQVFFSPLRYQSGPLDFRGYHAAHFLLVIGADGLNYLGAEVKYQPQHVIADAAATGGHSFLWDKNRLGLIGNVDSASYPALPSRHRGVLYNHLIERLKENEINLSEIISKTSTQNFKYPHIL